ncbi:MAG: Mth938-like domain-containing protein [Neisseria sp.]|nr:Mth938-like domain-containing protein [Neisseria sp.]
MQFTEHPNHDFPTVESYAEGRIEIGGKSYATPIVLASNGVFERPSEHFEQLDDSRFAELLAEYGRPEVVLIGSGAKQRFLHPKTAAFLAAQGIGLEVMNTASAARTLMILHGEGRSVWALLFP